MVTIVKRKEFANNQCVLPGYYYELTLLHDFTFHSYDTETKCFIKIIKTLEANLKETCCTFSCSANIIIFCQYWKFFP